MYDDMMAELCLVRSNGGATERWKKIIAMLSSDCPVFFPSQSIGCVHTAPQNRDCCLSNTLASVWKTKQLTQIQAILSLEYIWRSSEYIWSFGKTPRPAYNLCQDLSQPNWGLGLLLFIRFIFLLSSLKNCNLTAHLAGNKPPLSKIAVIMRISVKVHLHLQQLIN